MAAFKRHLLASHTGTASVVTTYTVACFLLHHELMRLVAGYSLPLQRPRWG